ncbi:hypothetical protein TRAPUB_1624 [Trametes pubescens]|uniref:Uncharacterized protein n=1 Tax=Trametes pubescens TaxID=154538 RepID=A0A1M2VIY5_TRAPU|nr:hypothetical protein TRAPUB_1624 [Trametes pubescens]
MNITVSHPMDQSFIDGSQHHPPNPSIGATKSPPGGSSSAYESWSWVQPAGPGDHHG